MKKFFCMSFMFLFLFGCVSDSNKPYFTIQPTDRVVLASRILAMPETFKLADYHLSGVKDSATALKNMKATAAGRMARCSAYAKAPGGASYLQMNMLQGMLALAQHGYRISVSELMGGGHSRRSRHYLGVAYDVTHINGVKVSWNNPHYKRYMALARELGATEVLGPGDRAHSGHLHIAWPRPEGL